MFRATPAGVLVLALLSAAPAVRAQSAPTDYRDEVLQHFDRSSRKIQSLARAMPDELYSWSPGEGVMSIARVYMHIARYNFMYLENSLAIPTPPDIDLSTLESIADKGRVTDLLGRSFEHARSAVTQMKSKDLAGPTKLYGRDVAGWAVLLQLVSHMNEHVGQSVAYARMNGVVPPWSR